jgi:surface polysaccharide O-acyltransferase-like enzyme
LIVKMYLLWADILKVIAVLGVIFLHVSAPFLVPFSPSREWWIGNIYDSLSRWCVPLFVMISGALILPKAGKVPVKQFLLVRVRRILVPFLIWSAVYFFYRIHIKEDPLVWFAFFRILLTEPVYYHLWFIYMLVVLYLFAPAISAFLNNSSRKHAWYLIVLWFFWASILPIIDTPLDFEPYFTPDMDDYSPLRLSGYFLLGYMLKDARVRSVIQWAMLILAFVIGGTVTVFGTYLMSLNRGEFDPFFYKYFSITVVIMTISLFIIVKSIFDTRKEFRADGTEWVRMNSPKYMRRLGMSVFGIYLIHALILELLRDGVLGFSIDHTSAFGIEMSAGVGIPVFAMSIFVLSVMVVIIIRQIPILRDLIA